MTQAPPPQLPGLTTVSLLGSGGFADVYRARHEILGRWVAVKTFRVSLDDPAAAQQFRAECQAVIRLQDELNVLKVFDANVLDDGRPYLLSELCDSSLQRLVAQRGGRLPADEVTEIGRQIATALVAAHFAGVLHGDVTPQNILLRSSGAPVLADFGLAVLRDYRGNTAAGFNPVHAAPETVRYDGAVDERTDVYGLGSTLYTAVTGQPPFPLRAGEQEFERGRRILSELPSPPAGAPAPLSALLLAMLAKDPRDRPAMAEVASSLATGASPAPRSVPAQARPVPTPPRYGPPPGAPPLVPAPPAPASQAAPLPVAFAPPAGVEPAPAGPVYSAPAGAAQDATRSRASTPDPATPVIDGGDRTRWRADSPNNPVRDAGPLANPSRRWWLRPPLLVGAASMAVAAGGLVAWLTLDESDQTPAAASTSKIQLAPPEDSGTSVTLRWTGPPSTDYAVLVEGDGREPQLVGRSTTLTVPVQPGVGYCFRVQGSTRGAVSESNVHAIRGATCRFSQ